MIMTEVGIYLSANNTCLSVAVATNGERESYNASNVFVDFETKLIKFDTKIYDRRIQFDNIAIAHNVKEQIKIKERDEK